MEFFGCLGAIVALAFLVLPIVAFVLAMSHRERMTSIERRIRDLLAEVDQLRWRIAKIENAAVAPRPAAEDKSAAPEPVAPEEAAPAQPGTVTEEPTPPVVPAQGMAAPFTAEAPTTPTPLSAPHEKPSAWTVDLTAVDTGGGDAAAEGPAREPEPPPPTPPPPSEPPPPTGNIGDALRDFDWESLIGVKLFSWIAGIALALAGVFFLRYSFEHGLLQPPVRMALGFVTGAGLLVLCELKIARNYRVTANALDAAGIALLYSTLFASHALWDLLSSTVTFPLMILVTAVAVLLSIRRDSAFIALLGLVGGFATPAMLSTGEDHPISLFSYLLLLNAGLAWVAYRKRWPLLTVLTLLFTTLYQWGWVIKFLGESKLPLAAGIFLVFPLFTVGAFLAASRDRETSSRSSFGASAAISAIVPITLAAYLAAVPAYGARYNLLFGFLLIIDLGLAALAASRRAPAALHAIGAMSTLVVTFVWLGLSYVPAAWPIINVWLAVFVAVYLVVPIIAKRFATRGDVSSPFDSGPAAGAAWVAPLLLFTYAAFPFIEDQMAAPALPFTVVAALVVAIGAFAIATARPGLFHLAALVAILAEAMWSSKHLREETLFATLVIYGAFAAIFMGVPVVARFMKSAARGFDSPVSIVFSILLLFFLAGGPVAGSALAGITALLILMIGGLIVASRYARDAFAPAIGMVLGWIVLTVWWSTATIVVNLIAALTTVALFASVILAGSVWLRRESEAASRPWNAWFALTGHAFLLVVASRADLALPPWPLFAVLAVLTIAVAIASRLLVAPHLLAADAIASQLVIFAWTSVARSDSWPTVAIIATVVVAAFFLAWRNLGVSDPEQPRATAAPFVALFLAQFITVTATAVGTPPFAAVLAAQLVIVGAILVLAAFSERHEASVLAAISSAFAYSTYRAGYVPERWWNEMTLATAMYASFVAYPIALGRRVGKRLEPHLAAVIASAFYFLFARTSIEWRGLGGAIGLLPLAQAALLVVVLRSLLRIEPPGERTMGRLAMVAGVVLAFVTVAIPLQLDKQWITIGWALEGAALMWLFRRIPHRGLLGWGTALLAIAFVRLALNPAVLAYHPRSATPIWNWYLYTYAVSAAALFVAARLAPRPSVGRRVVLAPLFATAGTVLLFLLLNIEIADFYSKGATITFNFSAGLAQDLTYTLGWAVFAIALLTAGLIGRNRTTRIASIALLLASVLKGFLHDLMRLGGLYRVGSLIGLAVALALVAVLLQKFVLSARVPKEGEST